jgi:hypothetical protein
MKQRHFQIELVNTPCCYNSVSSWSMQEIFLLPSVCLYLSVSKLPTACRNLLVQCLLVPEYTSLALRADYILSIDRHYLSVSSWSQLANIFLSECLLV